MQEKQFGAALVLHLAAAEPAELSQWGDCNGALAEELAGLSVREASALGGYWRHFCTLQLRSQQVLNYLQHVRARAHNADSLQALLERGAPFALLSEVGHMSWREYRSRAVASPDGGAGRPRLPTEQEKGRIGRALLSIRGRQADVDGKLGLTEWLVLSRMTSGIPLKVIWSHLSGGYK